LWLAGEGIGTIERLAVLDRKTVRRYVAAGEAAGLVRDGGERQLQRRVGGDGGRGGPPQSSISMAFT
jgi:hypothetical protein